MTFKKWLKIFKDVDHAIGDLSREVLSDKEFPNKIETIEGLTSYLNGRHASDAAIKTAENAYLYYSLDEHLVSYVDNELVWRSKD